MGSTGEPDRKRRHLSSISPIAGAAAKKHLLSPRADDKKLDVAVLQYQNQKVFQQLEAQKVEYFILEDKCHKLKEKQDIYDDIIVVANKSWDQLVSDLESRSICTRESTSAQHDLQGTGMLGDQSSFPMQDDFISRLLETGATNSCSLDDSTDSVEDEKSRTSETTKNILQNIISSINWMWHVSKDVTSSLRAAFSVHDQETHLRKSVIDLGMEVRSLILSVNDLHLKHRMLASKMQDHSDMLAKFKAEQKWLAGELASSVSELEESRCKLAILKSQKDGSKGAPILFPTLGNKHVIVDAVRDKQKEIQAMESSLKELKDQVSSQMVQINDLHERKIEILKKLGNLQNFLLSIKSVHSSSAFQKLKDQLDKSKAEMNQCQLSLAKLQAEKDNFLWHEKAVTLKDDLADVLEKVSDFSKLRIAELEQDLHKLVHERIQMEAKLEVTLREPGRKEIIAEFKELVTSLPKEMGVMQNDLAKFKESASEFHCLRAEVQSLSHILQWEVSKLQSLSDKFTAQLCQIKRLYSVVGDLTESEQELKLILEMYRRESTDSREVMESRDKEYKAWAHVQNLKSSLDEHNLESRVKSAIEAEALSQQKLAAAEAEIADLRQTLESTVREISKLSEKLKSKHEEGEAYLSEIESIGQAYEDMQTQNQHLLQQITERDDYNIKLVIEGVKARQQHDVVLSEIHSMDKKLQEANTLLNLYDLKAARCDEQLKFWSDQVAELVEDGWQCSTGFSSVQIRLSDVQRETEDLRHNLNDMQTQAENSRFEITELQIELEMERFTKKRIEEGLETMTMKATSVRTHTDGLAILEKLRQEIREYKGILKCRICNNRQKEVVIAKCYHLFCSQCVQRTIESRHRKCPTCSASFGPNDVKSIYI
ncbi:hypothetical protein HPP92_014644 [Vanilla planifolia]|uniref:E3 ubiquitin protein ligase n=1 Tax=Vanilla planifolia TaxID=51239 RepID=A0A835QNP4_VANPL|nr:hypothetical protein HPP92_014644 [Vanilla planifolia]